MKFSTVILSIESFINKLHEKLSIGEEFNGFYTLNGLLYVDSRTYIDNFHGYDLEEFYFPLTILDTDKLDDSIVDEIVDYVTSYRLKESIEQKKLHKAKIEKEREDTRLRLESLDKYKKKEYDELVNEILKIESWLSKQ